MVPICYGWKKRLSISLLRRLTSREMAVRFDLRSRAETSVFA